MQSKLLNRRDLDFILYELLDVESLTRRAEDHHERIVKLEAREDLLAQKMANVALQAVNSVTVETLNKIHEMEKRLEAFVAQASSSATQNLPRAKRQRAP